MGVPRPKGIVIMEVAATYQLTVQWHEDILHYRIDDFSECAAYNMSIEIDGVPLNGELFKLLEHDPPFFSIKL
jgi:hypothetical protein